MSKETRQLGAPAEAVSGLGVWRQAVCNLQRMPEAPPPRFWGEARPGVPLRPFRERARAPCGEQSLGAGSGNAATPGAPTWCPWAGAQASLGARKGPTLRPARWSLGLGAGLPAAGPGGAGGASSGRVRGRRASGPYSAAQPPSGGKPYLRRGRSPPARRRQARRLRARHPGSPCQGRLGGRRPGTPPAQAETGRCGGAE